MIKKNYEIPESELFFVKFEENFCQTGGNPNTSNSNFEIPQEENDPTDL